MSDTSFSFQGIAKAKDEALFTKLLLIYVLMIRKAWPTYIVPHSIYRTELKSDKSPRNSRKNTENNETFCTNLGLFPTILQILSHMLDHREVYPGGEKVSEGLNPQALPTIY